MVFLFAAVFAFFWHLLVKQFALACLGTVVTTVAIAKIFGSTHFGTFGSPLFYENAAGVGIIALIISIGVGLIFKKQRSKGANRNNAI